MYAKYIIVKRRTDTAAHTGGKAFGDGKAQAGGFTASGHIGGVEAVKNIGKIIRGDAVRTVLKGDIHSVVLRYGFYGKMTFAVGQGIA